ncbi:glycosyl hydrolase family 28-related protein [Micromonospora sp. M12]
MLAFGADPTGRRDSADAIDRAIAFARRAHLKVYIPPGTYQVNRHIIVDDVTIEGAGNWYTVIKGREVALPTPRRTARCTPASGSTAATPPTAAAATCTCPASPSRVTSGSASTPTRSTPSAVR